MKSPFANGKRRSIGPPKWLDCWKAATPACAKVILVCDNLNTHTKGAFYEAFAPDTRSVLGPPHRVLLHAQARQLAEHRRKRTEFPDTPVRRRTAASPMSQPSERKPSAWSTDVNATQRGVDWQMKIDDARTKLKSVYPKIKL